MIWVVGDKGMLGRELCALLSSRKMPYAGTDREVDIADLDALRRYHDEARPRWVINCAAYTNVDKAEVEKGLAESLNVDGPRNLAQVCAMGGSRLVHISTDYVFDGEADRPYRETDPVCPLGVYGATKANGEAAIMSRGPDAIIIRTSWLYGRHGKNFVHTINALLREKDEVGIVADQFGSPTWAFDLANLILEMVARADMAGGIYHYSGEGATSWYEFALEIDRQSAKPPGSARACVIKPLRTEEYPTKARRPRYSVLDKSKLKSLGFEVPEWHESLARFFETIQKGE